MEPQSDARPTVRCPTCRALQEWSDTCRRCKCDLRLLRAAADSRDRHRRRALRSLRDGRPAEALRHARHLRRLLPDADSACLLAACALLCGDWATAVALAEGVERED
jgi:hypothetical protein